MSNAPARSTATANIAKNRLYITIAGKLSKGNLDKLYTDIRFCVVDLKDGFDVITDLSGCTLAALNGLSTFQKITDYLITNKVGRVVRVIDERQVVVRQMLNLAAKLQGYQADYVDSVTQAEELIDTQDRNELRFYLHSQRVQYTVNSESGTGKIIDISASGCLIKLVALIPEIDEIISLSTTFSKHEDLLEVFEVQARIIRVDGDTFAVKFENLRESQREQLWERLVHESRCELP